MSVKVGESSESQISTVSPIYTKIYKLQLQLTVITINCIKCQWKLVKAVKVKFQLVNQFTLKFTNYNYS
jgi:hypothetical protein